MTASVPTTCDDQADRILRDPAMLRLDAQARLVAAGNIPVLLLGETGSGKEIFAEAIHRFSPRAQKSFLSLNCAALHETLLESELFGHERGAFTGAVQPKQGLLESADGGTVFLDEIGEMPPALQAKLLRVLEEGELVRVGGTRARCFDVRFVSATNRDLEEQVAKGTFRNDLYYRINAATLNIPPLRRRTSEILPLALLFVRKAAHRLGGPHAPEISEGARQMLLDHTWPGNVRELRNAMERAVLLCGSGPIAEEHLTLTPDTSRVMTRAMVHEHPGTQSERGRIIDALAKCGGNQTAAARLLGMSRQRLIRRIIELGLPRPKTSSFSQEAAVHPIARSA
jgi:transcriptional regulator with PAS, ATPase and Fis domain